MKYFCAFDDATILDYHEWTVMRIESQLMNSISDDATLLDYFEWTELRIVSATNEFNLRLKLKLSSSVKGNFTIMGFFEPAGIHIIPVQYCQ